MKRKKLPKRLGSKNGRAAQAATQMHRKSQKARTPGILDGFFRMLKALSGRWSSLNRYRLLLLMITIGGGIVRLYRVDFLSLWVDEYVHLGQAAAILHPDLEMAGDTNGIFLTWCMALLFKLFGTSEFTVRLPSVVFGTLTIPLVYLLARNMFNRGVGLIGAFLFAFSLFVVNWSRIGRNYASFEFAFMLLLITVWFIFNSKRKKESGQKDLFERDGISKKHLFILPLVLLFCWLNHQLVFVSLFGLGAYVVIAAVIHLVKQPKPLVNLRTVIAASVLVGMVLIVFPFTLEQVVRPVLGVFLPEKVINWVLPNWSSLYEQLRSENGMKSFTVYFNVLKDDYTKLYYLGIAGFVLSWFVFKNRNGAAFMCSVFLLVFGLHSFVFRDPHTPNYLYYVYPLFLISMALTIYWVIYKAIPYLLFRWVKHQRVRTLLLGSLTLVVLGFFTPWKEVKKLITINHHGLSTKKTLVHVDYVNWREIGEIMARKIAPDELVISSSRMPANFYLKRDNTVHFRQRHYDTSQKAYVLNKPDSLPNSAHTLEDLVRTYKKNPKGWFFADYYFDNVMTDPMARAFVIQNMNFHFNVGKEGDVKIFSWNHAGPKQNNKMVVVLGKGKTKQASRVYDMTIRKTKATEYMLHVETEGINSDKEAYLFLNKKYQLRFVPKAAKAKSDEMSERKVYQFKVKAEWVEEGKNTIQFVYNTTLKDRPKGYAVYNMWMTISQTQKAQPSNRKKQ